MIKYNIKTVNDWLYNSNPIKGMYYNGRRVYRRFVANGQPTPPTPPDFCRLTLNNGETVDIEGSGELTQEMIDAYIYTCVSAEIGTACTSIGDSAFFYCDSLSSCTIGDSVTSIGESAFNGCTSLTSIEIPNCVTSIGSGAFQNCYGLISATIGDGVTSIGYNAFSVCFSLTSVTIGSGVTSISFQAFRNCYGLTSITCNAIVPPTLGDTYIFDDTNNCPILVPSQSVDAYKTATNWSTYASRIQPIS